MVLYLHPWFHWQHERRPDPGVQHWPGGYWQSPSGRGRSAPCLLPSVPSSGFRLYHHGDKYHTRCLCKWWQPPSANHWCQGCLGAIWNKKYIDDEIKITCEKTAIFERKMNHWNNTEAQEIKKNYTSTCNIIWNNEKF